ncbi:hypothetical protein [Paracoccus sp. KR1-242]|uniref:hypothetical protein n=1 Tax=Paracoccus sp. KR1-242 TaxID=3410028 RepID=UPI003C05A57D
MVDVPSVPAIAETSQWEEEIPELQNGWRPTGGPVNPEADEGLLNWPLQRLANRTRHHKDRLDLLGLEAASLVTVGTGGDFATINEALIALSKRRPAYLPGGFTTELRLLAGFVMREQVIVRSVNLSWVTITSVDAEVLIDRSYLTQLSLTGSYPAFAAFDGGYLPTIDALFTMMSTGTAAGRVGMHLYQNGSATILSGKGFKASGGTGVLMNTGARLSANGAIISGSGAANVDIAGGSSATLLNADLRGAGTIGLIVSNGSTVSAGTVKFAGCNNGAIQAAQGSTVNAANATARCGASDTSTDIQVAGGSQIAATSATGGVSQAANVVTALGIIYR